MIYIKQNIFIGVDIGATKTIFLSVKIRGAKYEILETVKVLTPRKEKDILKMIGDNYSELSENHKISAIGIGFAGPVDFDRGAAIMGPNLKTGKIEFKKILERKLKIPVIVDNDAKCFILAESVFGAAKGIKNAVGLTIGTGIGMGIIINGEIYRGGGNFAGEIGHTDIAKDQEWETISSGLGLANLYKKISGKKRDSFEVVELARKKEPDALKAIRMVSENLGAGLANVVEIFNPEMIVFGGGLSEVGLILKKAKAYAKKKIYIPALVKTPVVVSELGQNSVALGAAWMAKKMKK